MRETLLQLREVLADEARLHIVEDARVPPAGMELPAVALTDAGARYDYGERGGPAIERGEIEITLYARVHEDRPGATLVGDGNGERGLLGLADGLRRTLRGAHAAQGVLESRVTRVHGSRYGLLDGVPVQTLRLDLEYVRETERAEEDGDE